MDTLMVILRRYGWHEDTNESMVHAEHGRLTLEGAVIMVITDLERELAEANIVIAGFDGR